MPSYVLSRLEKDFYKEAYIRRLYEDGYPATKTLGKFNKKFYNDHDLQGEKRSSVIKMIKSFNDTLKRRQNAGAYFICRKPELKEMLSAVMAEYQQKRGADDDENDGSEQEDGSDLEDVGATDQRSG